MSRFEEFMNRLNGQQIYSFRMTVTKLIKDHKITTQSNIQLTHCYTGYLYKRDKVYHSVLKYWNSDPTEPKEHMAEKFLNSMDN